MVTKTCLFLGHIIRLPYVDEYFGRFIYCLFYGYIEFLPKKFPVKVEVKEKERDQINMAKF